jgi:hypothetical protein
VFLYKNMGGTNLAYKALAPDVAGHFGYVRFSPDNYDNSSTLKALPTECTATPQQYVKLKTEGLTIQPADAVVETPPATPQNALDRFVHLKALAGPDAQLNKDYDQSIPKENKIATQFLIDRGKLMPVIENIYTPWYWEFYEYSKNAFGKYSKAKYCDTKVCGVSGLQLTLQLKEDKPFQLVSSRDPQRRLTLKSKDGKPIEITIGNSRKDDVECRGQIEEEPDGDFAHHYVMVLKGKRKCIPFPGGECGKEGIRPPFSLLSRGGSDCVGAQWP